MAISRKLVSLRFSPWSERAKWALDHHTLEYEVVEHAPVLGERRLRRIVGQEKPRATVPVLLAGDEMLTESWDIALYADREGRSAKLIGAGAETAVKAWEARADNAMKAGRALLMAAMLASPTALDESAPRGVPEWVRPLIRPIGRRAAMAFVRKYDLALDQSDAQTRTMRGVLDALRDGLRHSSPYLLGDFSYADIVMATMMQGVVPVADRFIKLRPATREVWTRTQIAADYPDLLAWRDGVYEDRRHPKGH